MGRARVAGGDRIAMAPARGLRRSRDGGSFTGARAGGRSCLLPLVVAALALSPTPAPAVPFIDVSGYIGAGTQYGRIASGNPSINGARGPGLQVVFGRRLRDRHPLYFDLRLGGMFVDVGPTSEIAFPSDRADYAVMALGGLWDFRPPGSRGPGAWVALHGTYHNLNWREFSYNIEGFGLSPGAGAHVHIPSVGVLRIGVTANFFSAKSVYEADASGQSFQFALDYLYEFRSRDGR